MKIHTNFTFPMYTETYMIQLFTFIQPPKSTAIPNLPQHLCSRFGRAFTVLVHTVAPPKGFAMPPPRESLRLAPIFEVDDIPNSYLALNAIFRSITIGWFVFRVMRQSDDTFWAMDAVNHGPRHTAVFAVAGNGFAEFANGWLRPDEPEEDFSDSIDISVGADGAAGTDDRLVAAPGKQIVELARVRIRDDVTIDPVASGGAESI